MPLTVTVTLAHPAVAGAVAIRIGGGTFHAVEFASVAAAEVLDEIAVPPELAVHQSTRTVAVRPAAATISAK
jgi:hypothetical protein